MYYWLFGFVLAMLSALIWPVLPTPFLVLWLCLLSIALVVSAYRFLMPAKGHNYLAKAFLFIAGLLLGIVILTSFALPNAYWSWQWSQLSSNKQVAQSAEHSIKGRVITLQGNQQGKINFNLRLVQLNGRDIAWPFQPILRIGCRSACEIQINNLGSREINFQINYQ